MAFFFAAPLLDPGRAPGDPQQHEQGRRLAAEVVQGNARAALVSQALRGRPVCHRELARLQLGDDPALPDAKPDDPRIERLAKYLVPKQDASARSGRAWPEHTKYFQSVTTARRTLERADVRSRRKCRTTRRSSGCRARSSGRTASRPASSSCCPTRRSRTSARSSAGTCRTGRMPWQRKPGVLIEALAAVRHRSGNGPLGGPPVENVAIDEEGDSTLARLATACPACWGLVLAWWSLRSVRLTLMVFACGVLSAAAGLGVRVLDRPDDRRRDDVDAVDALRAGDFRRGSPGELLSRRGSRAWPGRRAGAGAGARLETGAAVQCDDRHRPGVAGTSRPGADPQVRHLFGGRRGADADLLCSCSCRRRCTIWPVPLDAQGQRHDDHPDGLAGLGEGDDLVRGVSGRASAAAIIRHHAAVAAGLLSRSLSSSGLA